MLLAYIIVSLLVGGAIGAFFVEQGRASKGNRFHWVKRVQDGVTYRRCDRSGNPFTGFVLILAGLASFLLARFALSLMLGPYYRGLVIPAGFGFFALCALGSALVFLPAGINQFFLLESWAIVQRMVKGGRKDLRGVFEWMEALDCYRGVACAQTARFEVPYEVILLHPDRSKDVPMFARSDLRGRERSAKEEEFARTLARDLELPFLGVV